MKKKEGREKEIEKEYSGRKEEIGIDKDNRKNEKRG